MADLPQNEKRRPTPSPFQKLHALGLILQSLFFGLLATTLSVPLSENSTTMSPSAMALFYIGVALVLTVRARAAALDVPRFFGPALDGETRPFTLIAFPLCLLSLAGMWLLFLPVSFLAPDTVQQWLSRAQRLAPPQSMELWLAESIVAVFMAPAVEEVLFRGLLMQTWARKWGTMPAVMVSSALFAICHVELLGHFIFGVAMSVLYLRTRSLWVPIAAHSLNNFVASLASIGSVLDPHRADTPYTVANFRSEWPVGALSLVGAVVLLVVYRHIIWRKVPLRALLRGPIPYEAPPVTPGSASPGSSSPLPR